MSKNFEKYKKYYDKGYWDKNMIRNMVVKGQLTKKEYKLITGEDY